MLSPLHTHSFEKGEGALGRCVPSAAAVQGTRTLFQSDEVSIGSFGSQPPGVWYHHWWSRDGFGPTFHNRWLATSKDSWRNSGSSQIDNVWLKIQPEIYQCHPSTEGSQRYKNGAYTTKWEWTWLAGFAFHKLEIIFTKATIVQQSDPAKTIIYQTDARGVLIGPTLNLYSGVRVPRPVIFYSWNCSWAEQNGNTYNCNPLPIGDTPKPCKHYLDSGYRMDFMRLDYKILEYF